MPNSPNSMIAYSIVSGNEGRQFSLEGTSSPVVVLRKKLDYEAGNTFFNLTIKAEVGGSFIRCLGCNPPPLLVGRPLTKQGWTNLKYPTYVCLQCIYNVKICMHVCYRETNFPMFNLLSIGISIQVYFRRAKTQAGYIAFILLFMYVPMFM